MNIRPYDEHDEDAVLSLWRSCFGAPSPWNDPRENIRRKLGIQRELFLVAEIEGKIVGTAMSGYDGHRGWVYSVAVRETFRRQGIACELIRRVERELVAMGCPKINLMVRTSNLGVQAFYEKLGYQIQEVVTMGKVLCEHTLPPETRPAPVSGHQVSIPTSGSGGLLPGMDLDNMASLLDRMEERA